MKIIIAVGMAVIVGVIVALIIGLVPVIAVYAVPVGFIAGLIALAGGLTGKFPW